MKIYEIGTGYTPIPANISAATEIVVEELTKSFVRQKKQVEIIDIMAADRKESALSIIEVKVPRFITRSDVQLGIIHKGKRVVYSIALAGKLKQIIRKSNEKVVLHFHNQYNLFFFLKLTSQALRKKVKVAYTNHSGIWRLQWNEISSIIQKRYFQEAECMKKADIVFVLNEDTKANVVKHLGVEESRISVITNGVNTEVYTPLSESAKVLAKQQFGLAGKKVILQVGSVYENKGQERAVKLLAPMLKKNSDLVYAYAGGIVSEEYQNKIKIAAEEFGIEQQVIYLGMLSPGKKLNELYNAAEMTMVASEYEGFSLVIVESLSAGIPVLISRNAPFAIGNGCVLYDKANICKIVEEYILSSGVQYTDLCKAARENAVETYSWDKVSEDYFEYFRK